MGGLEGKIPLYFCVILILVSLQVHIVVVLICGRVLLILLLHSLHMFVNVVELLYLISLFILFLSYSMRKRRKTSDISLHIGIGIGNTFTFCLSLLANEFINFSFTFSLRRRLRFNPKLIGVEFVHMMAKLPHILAVTCCCFDIGLASKVMF